jgi:hypothetical protein
MSAGDHEHGGIVKVGIESSPSGSTSLLSASDTAGGRPRSGSLNKNDIHWRRGHVLGYVSSLVRLPVSPGYKLGVPTVGQIRR